MLQGTAVLGEALQNNMKSLKAGLANVKAAGE